MRVLCRLDIVVRKMTTREGTCDHPGLHQTLETHPSLPPPLTPAHTLLASVVSEVEIQNAEVLISNAPGGAYIVADAHTDPCSGAVSFGCGTAGSSSEWLLHGPTSSRLRPGEARGVDALAKIPPSMRGAGGAGAHAFDAPENFEDDQASGARLNQALLCRRGDFLYVPEGYWHSVRSTGLRVCVHYMLSQGGAGGA